MRATADAALAGAVPYHLFEAVLGPPLSFPLSRVSFSLAPIRVPSAVSHSPRERRCGVNLQYWNVEKITFKTIKKLHSENTDRYKQKQHSKQTSNKTVFNSQEWKQEEDKTHPKQNFNLYLSRRSEFKIKKSSCFAFFSSSRAHCFASSPLSLSLALCFCSTRLRVPQTCLLQHHKHR